jgi:hypothetical protein
LTALLSFALFDDAQVQENSSHSFNKRENDRPWEKPDETEKVGIQLNVNWNFSTALFSSLFPKFLHTVHRLRVAWSSVVHL